MSSAKNIDRLVDVRSEEFEVWQAQVRGFLAEKCPRSAELLDSTEAEHTASVLQKFPGDDDAARQQRATALEGIRKDDEAAWNHVSQFLSGSLKKQVAISVDRTGSAVWNELKKQHTEWMQTMGNEWQKKFEQLRPEPGQCVADYCNFADRLSLRLRMSNYPVGPLVVVSKVLDGLKQARPEWAPYLRGDVKSKAVDKLEQLSEQDLMGGQVIQKCGLRLELAKLEVENGHELAPRGAGAMAAQAPAPPPSRPPTSNEAALRQQIDALRKQVEALQQENGALRLEERAGTSQRPTNFWTREPRTT